MEVCVLIIDFFAHKSIGDTVYDTSYYKYQRYSMQYLKNIADTITAIPNYQYCDINTPADGATTLS